MPRIDPIQLLKCLSVLLSPSGGIKSMDELQRLAKLMTKFSKKLVSKCIYIQILKCTDTDLLGVFMGSGGWRLVHMWLTESIVAKNWPLVRELLELLLLCPVDVERLKTNNCPKLVKELSKDGNHHAIRALASKLVEQWLKTVKGDQVDPILISDIPQIMSEANFLSITDVIIKPEPCLDLNTDDKISEIDIQLATMKEERIADSVKTEIKTETTTDSAECSENNDGNLNIKEEIKKESEILPVLKITLKDGKQIISQVDDKEKSKHRSKDRSSEKSSSRSSKSSSSKHSSKTHSSSDKSKSSSHKSSSSPSRHSSKDKSKDKERRSSHGSSKSSKYSDSEKKSNERSSSSSSKSSKDKSKHSLDGIKDKSKEKDDVKNNKQVKTEKIGETPSIMKLGKIPKLSDSKKDRPSISIEVRKPDEPKPKTVKTFNSKFRNHGLAEEVRPPPSRATLLNKKPPPPVLPPTIPVPKRHSPVHNETPPEKKAKLIEPVEKPGAIKLIPPKPKPVMLLESDMFMDALNASATNKKEPKKRKRRTSGSKDGHPAEGSPQHQHTPPSPSPSGGGEKSVPPRFYQDTQDDDQDKHKPEDKEADNDDSADDKEPVASPVSRPRRKTALKKQLELETAEPVETAEPMETAEPHTLTVNGLKGVLCYHKKKGPKKSIKWKPDSELEVVQFFELDETERVNVTKTSFTDMKHLERIHERDAFQKSRNIHDDVMEEKTSWRPLILIKAEGQIHVDFGKNSKEKDLQAIRQKGTLQPLYFHKSMIPDTALEPEAEVHTYTEPTVIPLEDVTGNQDNISDFRNMPWPEPKGAAPPASSAASLSVPAMFPPSMAQFPNGFPPAQFPGVPPGFHQAPAMMPADWPASVMMAGGLPPGGLPPGLLPPPDGAMMMPPEMFGAPGMFPPVAPDGFNMMENMMAQNMFPPDFAMGGGEFPGGGGGGGYRGGGGGGGGGGGMRGRGGGWRGKGGWDGPPRGRGGAGGGGARGRKTPCIYFQRRGSCRQGDNCTFLHPGVNGPY